MRKWAQPTAAQTPVAKSFKGQAAQAGKAARGALGKAAPVIGAATAVGGLGYGAYHLGKKLVDKKKTAGSEAIMHGFMDEFFQIKQAAVHDATASEKSKVYAAVAKKYPDLTKGEEKKASLIHRLVRII